MKRYILVGLLIALAATSCHSYNYLVEDQSLLLAYQTDTTPVALVNLSRAYGETIKSNDKEGIRQPGLYADYATSLALLGYREAANRWFNREMIVYNNSARYINNIKLQLIPEYAMDTTSNAQIVDLSSFDSLLLTYSQADFQEEDNRTTLSVEDKKMIQRQKAKAKKDREREKKKQAKLKAKEKKQREKIKAREKKELAKAKAAEKEQRRQEAAAAKKQKQQGR